MLYYIHQLYYGLVICPWLFTHYTLNHTTLSYIFRYSQAFSTVFLDDRKGSILRWDHPQMRLFSDETILSWDHSPMTKFLNEPILRWDQSQIRSFSDETILSKMRPFPYETILRWDHSQLRPFSNETILRWDHYQVYDS